MQPRVPLTSSAVSTRQSGGGLGTHIMSFGLFVFQNEVLDSAVPCVSTGRVLGSSTSACTLS